MRPVFHNILVWLATGLIVTLVLVVGSKESKKARLERNKELAEIIATACGCKK